MNCRICMGPARRVFDLQSHRCALTVPVFRCVRCDAYFSNGGLVKYDDVDLTTYYLGCAEAIRRRYVRVFTRVEMLMRPGRFLDIGAGMGFSLEVARQRGWTSRGLEPNISLVRHANGRGLDIANGYLDDSQQGEHDFILVDNVLEHVPDPVGFLHNVRRLMSPSGLVMIAVPPMDWLRKCLSSAAYVRNRVTRPQINIFGEADEHLNMMSRRAMKSLVKRVGLEVRPIRFHHSPVYDNAMFRALGLDDGYYFVASH